MSEKKPQCWLLQQDKLNNLEVKKSLPSMWFVLTDTLSLLILAAFVALVLTVALVF